MATQVAWLVYHFFINSYVERPDGFAKKSIIAEAVDGPYMYDAVRISLWHEAAAFRVASKEPLSLDRFKHPVGIPASFASARWVVDNLVNIVVEEANELIPYVRAVSALASERGE
jgi:hypothetical protein